MRRKGRIEASGVSDRDSRPELRRLSAPPRRSEPAFDPPFARGSYCGELKRGWGSGVASFGRKYADAADCDFFASTAAERLAGTGPVGCDVDGCDAVCGGPGDWGVAGAAA